MTRIVGIDPGITGACALLDAGTLVEVHDMPVAKTRVNGRSKNLVLAARLADILRGMGNVHSVYVEKVHAMPKQGVSSSFSFGLSYGIVLGVVAALRIPVHHVTPQAWRKLAVVRGKKDGSRARAVELFPWRAADFARVKDDGRAEAALIAWAGHLLVGPLLDDPLS